jgi:cobalt/nickel transport system permease protein
MNFHLAMHLPDGVLKWSWLVAGFLFLASVLAWGLWGLRRVREEEIPLVALMSAAFFVASYIRVPAPLGSAHMLLNGLVGILLGRRAAVAIPLGLLLQSWLLGHGGLTVLGVNTAIMLPPALVAAWLFHFCKFSHRFTHERFRWLVGYALGAGSVLCTAGLQFLTVLYGSTQKEDLAFLAKVDFLWHLPIMVMEGILTGFIVNFLYRVKPAMLGVTAQRETLPAKAPPTGPDQPSRGPNPAAHPPVQSVPVDPNG